MEIFDFKNSKMYMRRWIHQASPKRGGGEESVYKENY